MGDVECSWELLVCDIRRIRKDIPGLIVRDTARSTTTAFTTRRSLYISTVSTRASRVSGPCGRVATEDVRGAAEPEAGAACVQRAVGLAIGRELATRSLGVAIRNAGLGRGRRTVFVTVTALAWRKTISEL
jgi:hypothetical protein